MVSVRTDRGLGFCNQEFDKFLEDQRIAHEKTNPYFPKINGCAEH